MAVRGDVARRQKAKPRLQPSEPIAKTVGIPSWLRVVAAVLVTVGSVIGTLLINGSIMVTTAEKFLSWHYEDADWKGAWSARIEGYIDHADMNLTENEDLRLSLDVDKGSIGGLVGTKRFCGYFPPQFIFLEGHVGLASKTAEVTAFDFVAGKKTVFAKLKLERERGGAMKVEMIDGPIDLFPKGIVRLGHHPIQTKEEEDTMFPAFCPKLKRDPSGSVRRPKG